MPPRPGRRLDGAVPPNAIARAIDTPGLVQLVPRLPAESLHRLIRAHGLEACGAIIAVATPAQITSVLDLDLWQPTPDGPDRLDAGRFGAWIEMLLDAGASVAARVVASLDPALVVAGLSHHIRVFDPAVLAPPGREEAGLDPAAASGLEADIGGYVVHARTGEAWDAIVGLLAALDAEQPDGFQAVMRGCRGLSNSTPELDGLDDLLRAPDQHAHDVSGGRDERLAARGYLTTEDARAFLHLARQSGTSRPAPASRSNPVVEAFFRDWTGAGASTDAGGTVADLPAASSTDHASAASADAVRLLATGAPSPPVAALPGADTPLSPIQPLLDHLRDADPIAYASRTGELAFLTNAVVSGCTVHDRPLTIEEASRAAIGACNIGLDAWSDRHPLPDTFLGTHGLIAAFEAGWTLLYREVSLVVAMHLATTLGELQSTDPGIRHDLSALRRALARHLEAGTPWRAAGHLDVVGLLDMPTWACLQGLLSECPVLPDAVRALVDGRATAVSATAFACFSSLAQVRAARRFAGDLGRFLRR